MRSDNNKKMVGLSIQIIEYVKNVYLLQKCTYLSLFTSTSNIYIVSVSVSMLTIGPHTNKILYLLLSFMHFTILIYDALHQYHGIAPVLEHL
jgi:hypothetical protein